uniref:Uncharacterized protein n=1 Tax=Xenopus tropicalis TaxID=8364 RepID=A0A1B8Y278_XENTR
MSHLPSQPGILGNIPPYPIITQHTVLPIQPGILGNIPPYPIITQHPALPSQPGILGNIPPYPIITQHPALPSQPGILAHALYLGALDSGYGYGFNDTKTYSNKEWREPGAEYLSLISGCMVESVCSSSSSLANAPFSQSVRVLCRVMRRMSGRVRKATFFWKGETEVC